MTTGAVKAGDCLALARSGAMLRAPPREVVSEPTDATVSFEPSTVIWLAPMPAAIRPPDPESAVIVLLPAVAAILVLPFHNEGIADQVRDDGRARTGDDYVCYGRVVDYVGVARRDRCGARN